jgi:proline racemase
MRRLIHCVETHTCGEPTRIVVGGLVDLPGDTIMAKQTYVREHQDHIRRALIHEPRGHRGMFGAILTPPVTPGAACGVIWFDNAGYLNGCGHGTIGVGIALVETGIVQAEAPLTSFVIDSPGGPLQLRVRVEGDRACETSFENVSAFSAVSDATVAVDGIGEVTLDIAFGGNFFAILDATQVGLEVRLDQAGRLAAAGKRIRDAVNDQIQVRHPTLPHLNRVEIVTFLSPPTRPEARYRSTHMFADGAMDRSPGGTGTSALMATLHAKARLGIGEELVTEGIVGGTFKGRLLRDVRVGDAAGVVPEVTGSAFVTGYHQFVLDSNDPWLNGFELG